MYTGCTHITHAITTLLNDPAALPGAYVQKWPQGNMPSNLLLTPAMLLTSGKALACHPLQQLYESNMLLSLLQEGEPAGCLWLLQEGSLHAIKHAVQWEELEAPALVGARAHAPFCTSRLSSGQQPLRQ